jgi:hypothetical protein
MALAAAAAVVSTLAGCVGIADTPLEMNVRLMLSYDANSDGTVTRAELEAGLMRQFAADMNHGGFASFDEFAARARSVFAVLDRNNDGRLSSDEMRLIGGAGLFPGSVPGGP